MRRLCWLSVVLFALVSLSSAVLAAEIAELTVAELVGAARTNEPVRMGIPLGPGVAKDVTELGLIDEAGKPVPCQFREVMRWPEDESLRWVHVVFQASVPAKGTVKVKLVKDKPAQTAGKMSITPGDGAVAVDNGLLKLVFKAATLIDSASIKGVEVVKPHKGGFVATIGGKEYRPSADSKVEIEEKGTEGAVVRISGKLVDDAGQGPFAFVCYAHVYQNSPEVRLDVAYTNVQGKDAGDFVRLEDLSVVIPTALVDAAAKVGGAPDVYSGKAGSIVAKDSDQSEIVVDGNVPVLVKGKSRKPLTIGWAGLSSGNAGLAAGVRWFWQMFPKAVEAGNGTLRVGLYAREAGTPLDVYMGQGRTHYVTLLFHEGQVEDAALAAFFSGRQMPLRAVCTPKYYCRDSQGFGKVADSDPAIYPEDVAAAMQAFDVGVKSSAQAIDRKIDGHEYNRVMLDSYGYNAWGDLFHHANAAGVKDPWNILWESNYYDYPWTCALQFARTGEMLYLDIADRHGLHMADVFMCKWHPREELRGACRYSPPANHVGLDTDYKAPKPYVSVEFNHHKAQGILVRYYLLGDLRARDDFMLALNNAMKNPEGAWRQCRGPGAKLATLYSGYILTRDKACLEKMKQCMAGAIKLKNDPKGFSRQGPSGYFMMGIATEGMCYYWWLTGDKDTFETIKSVTDFQMSDEGRRGTTANAACAAALVYRETGDEKYRKFALGLLRPKEERRPKNFAQGWRSSAYAWYYLSNLGEKK